MEIDRGLIVNEGFGGGRLILQAGYFVLFELYSMFRNASLNVAKSIIYVNLIEVIVAFLKCKNRIESFI